MQAGISKSDEQRWLVCIHHRVCHGGSLDIFHICSSGDIVTKHFFCTSLIFKILIFDIFFFLIILHLAACGYLLIDLKGDDGPAMRADAAAFLPGQGYVKETPEVHSDA